MKLPGRTRSMEWICTSTQALCSFSLLLFRRFVQEGQLTKSILRRTKMRYALYTTLMLIALIAIASPVSAADQRSFRVVGNEQYQILEAKDIYIYSADILVRKGTTDKAYFFSVGPNGEVLPLTIVNLKKAFPDNHRFHDVLDMAFKNDSQLTKYDDFHKMFKVNRLLIASEQ
jgi:hypothetical protein